jgi:hypothetical protein
LLFASAKSSEKETERVSTLTVDCSGGDYGACDELFHTGTNVDYARTCGEFFEDPIPGGTCAERVARDQEKLRAGCADGDFADCDELYFQSDGGSEAEEFGATCGGLTEGDNAGACEETNGGTDPLPFTRGDDAALDALWDSCAAGDFASCDALYSESDSGSGYEEFGSTCGHRIDATDGACEDELGASGASRSSS